MDGRIEEAVRDLRTLLDLADQHKDLPALRASALCRGLLEHTRMIIQALDPGGAPAFDRGGGFARH